MQFEGHQAWRSPITLLCAHAVLSTLRFGPLLLPLFQRQEFAWQNSARAA
jgi:hypothetical protein